MTFPLPPNEAVIYAEFVRLLDAREVAAIEPRRAVAQYGDEAEVAIRDVQEASPGDDSKVGAAHTLPLFPNEERAA